VTLAATLACAVSIATAQTSETGKFKSENKSVTFERFEPKTTGDHPGVIVVHGGGGPDGDWRKSGILEALTAANYLVFVPHYFDGPGGKWKRSDDPKQFLVYIRTLNDTMRAVAQQKGIAKAGVGFVGFSLGGYLVLGLAEEEKSHPPRVLVPQIKAVVEMYGGMPEFAADRMTTMPPTLILHGAKDTLVTVDQAHEAENVLKAKSVPYEIKIYPDQGHGFEGGAAEDANQRTVEFLKKYLH
jgi:carboxymethylenebutenolidase